MAVKRKLIEVALPLEAINASAVGDSPKRKGHPWRLHFWWARRKLVVARAVLFAQLVDDPSVREDEFIAEAREKGYKNPEGWADQRINQERERLFDLIRRMVDWGNLGDGALFDAAHAEIMKSTNDNPPTILDPFAGGGTIPLEAQRLGLEAHASDLNPVAVLINKALVDVPPKFAGIEPVFPGAAGTRIDWPKATGLAEDVRRYGEWVRDEAQKRIGHLYPKATLPGGGEATVIAWVWARTVACPNPACGIEMPLVRSWWLGKKRGKEAYVVPRLDQGRIKYEIGHDPSLAPTRGTVTGGNGVCVACATTVPNKYIREQATLVGLGARLIAVIAEGQRQRVYLPATDQDEAAASVARPDNTPDQVVPTPNHDVDRLPMYGMPRWSDAFTNRQSTALITFSDLVAGVRECVLADARAAGMIGDTGLEAGGVGATAYADAVVTYLGLSLSRATDYWSSLTSWHFRNEQIRNVFARQAIPMVWDFLEVNVLGNSAGSWTGHLGQAVEVLNGLQLGPSPTVEQRPAQAAVAGTSAVISTDPPYYDNVGYSDLSDFFYVWIRRSLSSVYPDLLGTMLVPKADELVANHYRHGGRREAKTFFEEGFAEVFARARENARADLPITVYYAFKQEDTSAVGETASAGWETLLQAMVRGGWRITATWPFRTETSSRLLAQGTNALASSVVLALRPREPEATVTDRRGFIAAMKRELGQALRELQQGGIAPVDLPQSAIGPGMAVFSRYAKVIESDGSEMTVRSALARINEMLDELLTEQEGDFDPTTRFAIAWYRSNGYDAGAFGDAENLARARATAVSAMERGGILSARAGKVQLYRPVDLPDGYDVTTDQHASAWEALQHTIRIQESKGIPAAGAFLHDASRRSDGAVDLDLVKELAYLLFQVAEKNGWTKDAISFNGIATSWSELLDSGRTAAPASTVATLDFDALDE